MLQIAVRAEGVLIVIEHVVGRPAAFALRSVVRRRAPRDLVAEAHPARNGTLAFVVDHGLAKAQVMSQA